MQVPLSQILQFPTGEILHIIRYKGKCDQKKKKVRVEGNISLIQYEL